MSQFIAASTVASIAGISRQAIEKALTICVRKPGFTWRGASLVIRTVHGRGGRGGLQYQVRVDSLPIDLQRAFQEAFGGPVPRPSHGEAAQAERAWLFGLIRPALAHPKNSRERAAALAELAGREHGGPDGKWRAVSLRTLQRAVAAFEAHGLAGLGRRKRVDAGEAAVILSRRWDRAVPFDDDGKARVATDLRTYVRSLIKDGLDGAQLVLTASFRLALLTRRAGFDPGEAELSACCAVPQQFLRRERHYRAVHTLKTDIKAHEDKRRPRVRRTIDGLLPMDIVVADVHHVDILASRWDNSIATAKAIAWLDMATKRAFMDFFLLDKGEGVTNALVIRSFINMVRAWGCPRALYIDNGTEYNWAAFVDDALKLIDGAARPGLERVEPWDARSSHIVRALPYNAPAKPIEGLFNVLESRFFSRIPGWIGGDRMRKKSALVGREPDPFPGDFDALRDALNGELAAYHGMPSGKRSALKGLSPNGAFKRAIDAGWGMTAVDPNALRLAFSRPERRDVSQGSIRYGGHLWTADALYAYPGDHVTLLAPKYEEQEQLAVLDDAGNFLCVVEPDTAYGYLDPGGAQESARRRLIQNKAYRALDHSVPNVNSGQELRSALAALPAPPQAPVFAQIAPSDAQRVIADSLKETPTQRADRQHREAQNALAKRVEISARHRKGRAHA